MMNHNLKPILIFWETTKACKLKCKHCRAEAILEPLPDELTTEEAYKLIDDIKRFGKPYPVLIFTGGDPLMRPDIIDIAKHGYQQGIPLGIAPAVTELLNDQIMDDLLRYGVKYVSISLDGGRPDTHDYVRGVEGHLVTTIHVLKKLIKKDLKVQINTLAAKDTVRDFPHIVKIMKDLGISVWEIFFLIHVGRGVEVSDLSPQEYEDVNHFLYEVTRYGIEVRTVEAPFYRRIVLWRRNDPYDKQKIDIRYIRTRYGLGNLYEELTRKLLDLLGQPYNEPNPRIPTTRDGKGIIFVAYNGDVYPSGFAPYKLGNVRKASLVRIYRGNRVLKMIRETMFRGKCGYCEYKDICGGSRARAYAENGDILGEDPACTYNPPKTIFA